MNSIDGHEPVSASEAELPPLAHNGTGKSTKLSKGRNPNDDEDEIKSSIMLL